MKPEIHAGPPTEARDSQRVTFTLEAATILRTEPGQVARVLLGKPVIAVALHPPFEEPSMILIHLDHSK